MPIQKTSPRPYKNVSKATPEQFIASSIIRFGRLHGYIQEKMLVDYFAIKGNLKIAEGLDIYIQKNLENLRALPKINLLDIGPAIGAISTLICLQTLNKYGLLEKTRVYLVDVSENVINSTQQGEFLYPLAILDSKLKNAMIRKLKNSKSFIGSAEKTPWKNDFFQIIVAGFLFHHLHDSVKPLVAAESMRLLAPNGFIGIAEEWFKNYGSYAKIHEDDQIPLAYESLISYKKLLKILPGIKVIFDHDKNHRENSYVICGTK